MKRVIVHSALFVISFVICALTIYSMNWLFWVSLIVFAYTCNRMERFYDVLHGEIDDLFGHDSPLK